MVKNTSATASFNHKENYPKAQNSKLINLPANRLTNISEHEIATALYKDDQAFFSMIYDYYAAILLGMIFKWVKQKDLAEILLCEAFVKAWKNRKKFDAENEIFYCWLCSQARVCYNESCATA
jgi:hypothetical protein